MKIKLMVMLFFILGFTAVGHQAEAACDPCKCGPGGDYKGDIGQWFRDNCPGRGGGNGNGGGRGNPPPPRSSPPGANCDDKCPEGYLCLEGRNQLGPVFQCYIPAGN